ncbi:hypothetical protein [Methylobacterium sp. Leaf118]|uniref:hypothetical protein n=1 Tax=Methylobacterium sp. Leaf118 TaxID=2876562 RepID=UPI001E2B3347|nr:hypothetical protein [Methylobacterium sp. Leaf118]
MDKVFEVDLVENHGLATPARFFVNVRHGRRGAVLREGTRTPQPVPDAAAEAIFESVVVSKINAGYRRIERGATGAGAPAGREGVLLARLAACRREDWPERDRERLLWRIGQLRIARAGPDLIGLAQDLGPARASYSLVWALARLAGAEARPTLAAVAAATGSVVIRDLVRFALAAPDLDEAHETGGAPDLPATVAHPAEAGDCDGLCAALDALARHEPGRVGPALVALGRRARRAPVLHATLCAAILRLPPQPPYLIGLRRLFKHAEMADDPGLFGATAHRFESVRPVSSGVGRPLFLPERGRIVPAARLRHGPDATVGLSVATWLYLRRRIWRILRKRGDVGDPAFAEMATGFLLTLRPEDLDTRIAWTAQMRRPDGTWGGETRARGRLGQNWTASQLLYRHAPGAVPQPWKLTFLECAEPDPNRRDEAFPDLWRARPDLALRLAAEAAVEPAALLGVRVLRADPLAREAWTTAEIARLLKALAVPAQQLGFEAARDRLARGPADPDLLAALIASDLPEARALALLRIEADPPLPWSRAALAFALLTSPAPDVAAAVLRFADRAKPEAEAAALGRRLTTWLLARPTSLGPADASAIRAMRSGLEALWPGRDMPEAEGAVALLRHPAPEVVAAGLDFLSRAGVDPGRLSPDLWASLIGSASETIQEALLRLLASAADARLAAQADVVLALANGPSPVLRIAARPLVVRLAAADPGLAERLAGDLIASLFRTAPDATADADTVALLTEAMPGALAALDPGTLWRLLQAKAKGAQRLGATLLPGRAPDAFSVRQIARLGGHAHAAVRRWAMAAFAAEPARFQAEAAEAVLLIESPWPEVVAFAQSQFETWPDETWTPPVLALVTDSVQPDVLAFARHLLRSRLRPGDVEAHLPRLLEHPSPSMHLLITEVLTEAAVASEAAFARLIPLARMVMLQVLKGRIAKDRMAAFLHAEALRSRARAERLMPLFADLSLSGTARDRAAAILTLRDIAEAHPGLGTPLVRLATEARTARAESAR